MLFERQNYIGWERALYGCDQKRHLACSPVSITRRSSRFPPARTTAVAMKVDGYCGGRVNNSRNNTCERYKASSVRFTEFDLLTGAPIKPFLYSRSVVAQSKPFQAQRPLCRVNHNSAKTALPSCPHRCSRTNIITRGRKIPRRCSDGYRSSNVCID